MPKVSVCIPAYNQIKYLKRTIDSVLSQNYSDYEIVITDDSSSDIVRDFVNSYNMPVKIRYFKNAVPLGSPENWNEAIRKANGEYIKIIHHDDWLTESDSLNKYVNLLDDNPDVNFAFSGSHVVFEDGSKWIHSISEDGVNELKNNPNLLLIKNLIGAPSAVIFKKDSNLIFDRNLRWLVDVEYYTRILHVQKFAYTIDPLIVTFGALGRVTDECENNKVVEVFEYFYCMGKMQKSSQIKVFVLHAFNICDQYRILKRRDIVDCGYNGTIHPYVLIFLQLKKIYRPLSGAFKKLINRS